jgi:hypothetical protein
MCLLSVSKRNSPEKLGVAQVSNGNYLCQYYIHTTHALSPRQRHLKYSSETPTFYQNYLAMKNTADVTGGKSISVWSQSISGVSAINFLVAFYDIHGRKRGAVLLFSPGHHKTIFSILNKQNGRPDLPSPGSHQLIVFNAGTQAFLMERIDNCFYSTRRTWAPKRSCACYAHRATPTRSSYSGTSILYLHHYHRIKVPTAGLRPHLWITHKANGP